MTYAPPSVSWSSLCILGFTPDDPHGVGLEKIELITNIFE